MIIDYSHSWICVILHKVVFLGINYENIPQNQAPNSVNYHRMKTGPQKLMKFSQLSYINKKG